MIEGSWRSLVAPAYDLLLGFVSFGLFRLVTYTPAGCSLLKRLGCSGANMVAAGRPAVCLRQAVI
jgi:hypothetical protein